MDPEDARLGLVIRTSLLLVILPLTKEVQVLKQRREKLVNLVAKALLPEVTLVSLFVEQLTFALFILGRLHADVLLVSFF